MPYHFTPHTKRPKLPPIPDPNTPVLVYDHTYASYAHVLTWIKRHPNGFLLRHPCCRSGCSHRDAHDVGKCQGELLLNVALVEEFGGLAPVDEGWVTTTQKWMKRWYERVHDDYVDIISGRTRVGLVMDEFPSATEEECRAVLAVRYHVPPDEFRIPSRRAPASEWIPPGLIGGPVPFDAKQAAEFTLAVLGGKPNSALTPPLGFETTANGKWSCFVRAEPGETHVDSLPYKSTLRDFPDVRDVGTWSKPMYESRELRRSFPWRVVAGDVEYSDPAEYVKAWIRAKLEDMECKRFDATKRREKQNVFVRSIWVNKPFTNANGDRKREYLDEYKEFKRRRIASVFGREYVDTFMNLPIGIFGPDYEEEDSEDEDDREEYNSDDEEEEEREPKRRRTTKIQKRSVVDVLRKKLNSVVG